MGLEYQLIKHLEMKALSSLTEFWQMCHFNIHRIIARSWIYSSGEITIPPTESRFLKM